MFGCIEHGKEKYSERMDVNQSGIQKILISNKRANVP